MQTQSVASILPVLRVCAWARHGLTTPLRQVTLEGQRMQAVPLVWLRSSGMKPGRHRHWERLLALMGEVELGGHRCMGLVEFRPGHQKPGVHAPHSPVVLPKVPGLQKQSAYSEAAAREE